MLEQAKNELQECINVFKEDSNKCADKETWFLLYDKLGEDLSVILKCYKSFELGLYTIAVLNFLFEPADATS